MPPAGPRASQEAMTDQSPSQARTSFALELYLRRLTNRSPLNEEEKAALLDLPAQADEVTVERDFVHPGDRVTHACLIADGLVARFAQIKNGNRSFVALHIPGDMADLHSVVAPNVSWALHALTPTLLLRIPHPALRSIASRYPAVAIAFWRDCVVDANILAQWHVNVSRKDAAARVAHLMCELACRYEAIGLSQGGDRFPLPITQADMADAVGLTAVHLNRVLKRLSEQGLLLKEQMSVTILDRRRLVALAEFDADYLELGCDRRD